MVRITDEDVVVQVDITNDELENARKRFNLPHSPASVVCEVIYAFRRMEAERYAALRHLQQQQQ